jgi:hypothetical protein
MSTTLVTQAARRGRGATVRGVLVTIAVSIAALLAGCSIRSSQPSSPVTSGGAGSAAATDSGSSGNASTNNQGSRRGNEATGSYTAAFAACMRANGVPNFPDPNGQSGQLGPNSAIAPTSAAFQAAINGPCLSLAPPGWVSSGKVTR